MSRAGDTAIAGAVQHRRRVVVDVILLLMRNGRILLRERANTGYGDGAYEPPTGQLADRETIVETAIRVASAEAGIAIRAENVSLAHVMHDVSGSGRIAFFLTVTGWHGEFTSPDARWFGVGNLPTNMLDRSRVALRNYAEGMRFSTYPAFGVAGTGGSTVGSTASGTGGSTASGTGGSTAGGTGGSTAGGTGGSAVGGPALFGTLHEAAPWQDAYSA